LPRLQRAIFLGRLDDAQRQPVFDRAERTEGFDLDVEIDALGAQLVDPHRRGVADRTEDGVEFHGSLRRLTRVLGGRKLLQTPLRAPAPGSVSSFGGKVFEEIQYHAVE